MKLSLINPLPSPLPLPLPLPKSLSSTGRVSSTFLLNRFLPTSLASKVGKFVPIDQSTIVTSVGDNWLVVRTTFDPSNESRSSITLEEASRGSETHSDKNTAIVVGYVFRELLIAVLCTNEIAGITLLES